MPRQDGIEMPMEFVQDDFVARHPVVLLGHKKNIIV